MANVIAEMLIRVGVDNSQLTRGLAAGKSSMNSFVQDMGAMGRKMTMGFTLPVAGIGIAVTKMAMDFETNMTNIYTLMDDATIKSRNWGDEILEMSKKTGESTDTLSKGLYDIVSSGIDASDAMGLLNVSTKAAKAGLADTAISVKAITAILNAYGMDASKATEVSDTLFQTVKYGVTTFPELAGAIGGVISTAAAANISIDEVGAALATMTLAGISTDEAVTALNQVILSFLKPTDQAKEAAAAMNFELSATALSTKGLGGIFRDLGTKLKVTVDDIVAMEKAGMDENEILDEMAFRAGTTAEAFATIFPNVRALKGALVLASQEGELFNGILDDMGEKTGATEAAFAKMAETSKFKFDIALAKLKAAGIDIGQNLLPSVVNLFEWVGKLADQFGELPEPVQDFIIKGVGIAALIPPILWFISSITNAIVKLKALRTAMMGVNAVSATGFLTQLAGGAGAGAVGVGGVLASIVALVGGLANRLGALTKAFATNEIAVMSWNDRLQEMVNIVLLGIPEILTALGGLFGLPKHEFKYGYGAMIEGLFGTKKATEEVVDVEEERMKNIEELTKTLWAYGMADEHAQELLYGIEDAYNHNMISAEGYEKALQYLMDSQGKWEGSAEELLSTLGLLPEAYYEKKEAMDADKEATEETTEAYENQIKTLEELMETLFKFYNQNAGVVESLWAYQDASEELNKWLSENKDLTDDQIRNSREYAEKVLGVSKEIQNMVQNVSDLVSGNKDLDASQLSVIQQFDSVRDAIIHAGLAAVQMKSISYSEFEMWAQNIGISTGEVSEYIQKVYEKYGMMPNLVETEIIAEDLATDMVEAIVGDLNNLDERPNVSVGIEAKDLTVSTINTIMDNLIGLKDDAEIPIEAKNMVSAALEEIVGRLNDIRNEPNINIPVEIKWLTERMETLQSDLEGLRNVPTISIPVEANDLITSTIEAINKELDNLNEKSIMATLGVEIEPESQEQTNSYLDYIMNWQADKKIIETEVESEETEIKLDELDYYRIGDKKFKISADTSEATRGINSIQQMLNSLKDKNVNVTFKMAQVGAMPAYSGGGLIRAQQGLYVGGSGPRPVIVDPPELIFNKDQALTALWNLGQVKGSPLGGSGNMDLSGKLQIEFIGEGADRLSESLVSEMVTDRIIKHFKEEGARK